jgi:hypothetical protein
MVEAVIVKDIPIPTTVQLRECLLIHLLRFARTARLVTEVPKYENDPPVLKRQALGPRADNMTIYTRRSAGGNVPVQATLALIFLNIRPTGSNRKIDEFPSPGGPVRVWTRAVKKCPE